MDKNQKCFMRKLTYGVLWFSSTVNLRDTKCRKQILTIRTKKTFVSTQKIREKN